LLRNLFDIDPVCVKPSSTKRIGVGSIIAAYYRIGGDPKPEYSIKRIIRRPLHVWGSGFMDSGTPAA